jgi:hypothetical protein
VTDEGVDTLSFLLASEGVVKLFGARFVLQKSLQQTLPSSDKKKRNGRLVWVGCV